MKISSEAQRFYAYQAGASFKSKKAPPAAVSAENRKAGERKRRIEELRETRELADQIDHFSMRGVDR